MEHTYKVGDKIKVVEYNKFSAEADGDPTGKTGVVTVVDSTPFIEVLLDDGTKCLSYNGESWLFFNIEIEKV